MEIIEKMETAHFEVHPNGTLLLPLKEKYRSGSGDPGKHGKCSSNGLRPGKVKKVKHKVAPQKNREFGKSFC